jgi:carboxylate-amine ligase
MGGAAGTHPFQYWQSQLITEHVRYNEIVNELQEAARSNLILGCMCMWNGNPRYGESYNSTRISSSYLRAQYQFTFWEGVYGLQIFSHQSI